MQQQYKERNVSVSKNNFSRKTTQNIFDNENYVSENSEDHFIRDSTISIKKFNICHQRRRQRCQSLSYFPYIQTTFSRTQPTEINSIDQRTSESEKDYSFENNVSNRSVHRQSNHLKGPLTNPVYKRFTIVPSSIKYDVVKEDFIRKCEELEELKYRTIQMEKTMRWWSDCTAKWREKWSKARQDRHKAKEEIKSLQLQISILQKAHAIQKSPDKPVPISVSISIDDYNFDQEDMDTKKSNRNYLANRLSITSSGWEEAFLLLQEENDSLTTSLKNAQKEIVRLTNNQKNENNEDLRTLDMKADVCCVLNKCDIEVPEKLNDDIDIMTTDTDLDHPSESHKKEISCTFDHQIIPNRTDCCPEENYCFSHQRLRILEEEMCDLRTKLQNLNLSLSDCRSQLEMEKSKNNQNNSDVSSNSQAFEKSDHILKKYVQF